MDWAIKYNKKYETLEDYKLRANLFIESLKLVEEQNKKDVSLKFGLNHMSDWLPEEFEATLGLKDQVIFDLPDKLFYGSPKADSIDWRDVKDVVAPVKDQGMCGSCWAFSSISAIESAYVIAGNEQVIMSEQELVDCSRGLLSNHGCNGGFYYYAYNWLKHNKTMREEDYAYVSGQTRDETEC